MQHGAHQRTARRREQQAPPAAPEHPQGLGQQHGGAVVADGPRHQHAHQQGQHLVVLTLLEAPPEQLVEEQSSQQGGKARDAAAEHRLHPAHGHHVAGGLAAAPAVQQPGDGQQRRPRQGVHADEPEVLQLHSGEDIGVIARAGQLSPLEHLFIGAAHPQVVFQVHRGAQPLHHAGIAAAEAENEALGEGAHQPVQHDRQEVQQEVHRRQGEDIAGDEGRRRGGGEVEKAQSQHRQDGDAQALGVKAAAHHAHHHAQPAHDDVGDEHHGHAGEEVGEKQPLPPDGQGVQQSHAAAVIQVAPHQHGAEDGVQQRHDGHRVGRRVVVHLREIQGPVPQVKILVPEELHQKRQGEQAPGEGRHAPQRPEPGQVPAQQCGVKILRERCL